MHYASQKIYLISSLISPLGVFCWWGAGVLPCHGVVLLTLVYDMMEPGLITDDSVMLYWFFHHVREDA
jgi:hypothetical protein